MDRFILAFMAFIEFYVDVEFKGLITSFFLNDSMKLFNRNRRGKIVGIDISKHVSCTCSESELLILTDFRIIWLLFKRILLKRVNGCI